jgi:hypothetical protein
MMEPGRPVRHDLYDCFSYGAFDRIGVLAFFVFCLSTTPKFFAPGVSTSLLNMATAGLFVLSMLLLGWFALARNTLFIVDGHGIRAVVFGLTRKRISWSDVTRVTEQSVGRGMKTMRISSGGIAGRPKADITVVSDLGQYSSLKHILRDQSQVFGFSDACQLGLGQPADVSNVA